MFYTSNYASPLGDITLASDGKSITGVWFVRQKYYADNLPEKHEQKDLPVFDITKKYACKTRNNARIPEKHCQKGKSGV